MALLDFTIRVKNKISGVWLEMFQQDLEQQTLFELNELYALGAINEKNIEKHARVACVYIWHSEGWSEQ